MSSNNTKSIIKLLEPESNLRVDRKFGFQIGTFKKYGDDEQLLKDLIIYMSLNHQKNLFGYISFDLDNFCEVMKYDRKNLLRAHSDPIFYKLNSQFTKEEHLIREKDNGNDSEYRVWKNKLENALLILQHESLYIPNEKISENHKKISHTNFTYLKEVSILFKKKGRTKKFYYQYIPTPEFQETLERYFLVTNLVNYLNIKKSKLSDLYFNILYRSQNQESNSVNFNFKFLAELMNISTKKINEEKGWSYIKQNLIRKFNHKFKPNVEDEITGIKLKFIKSNKSNYNNIPVISWDSKKIETLEETNKIIYQDLFYTKLIKDLSINYYQNYQTLELDNEVIMKGFLSWMFTYEDISIKQGKYLSIYADTYGNKVNIEEESKDFFFKLTNLGTYQIKRVFMKYDK